MIILAKLAAVCAFQENYFHYAYHYFIVRFSQFASLCCVKGIQCGDVLKAMEILLTSYRLRMYFSFFL